MKTRLLGLIVIIAAVCVWALPAAAQEGGSFLPTIFRFTADLEAVTLDELESGELETTLEWHVAHVADPYRLLVQAYQSRAWVTLAGEEEALASVGSATVPAAHPNSFGPLTYRLIVIDAAGQIVDESVLVVPFAEPEASEPLVIESFTSTVESVDLPGLEAGTVRVPVAWDVTGRQPLMHIGFVQILPDGSSANVELPRANLWVPSSGEGAVAPVAAEGAEEIELQLVVVDAISAEVLDEASLTLPVVDGVPVVSPPTFTPSVQETPAVPVVTMTPSAPAAQETPAVPTYGRLIVETACEQPPAGTVRDWIDVPAVPSGDGSHTVAVTNTEGAAQLTITPAEDGAPVEVASPNAALPLGADPQWSPDGTRLVFSNIILSQPGGGYIYAINADGTGLQQLAAYTGYYDALSWSPDGTQICFTSGVSSGTGSGAQVGDYQLYSVPADGSGNPAPVVPGCGVTP
jgi:hypothetical protein